jgi:hypothetical protein
VPNGVAQVCMKTEALVPNDAFVAIGQARIEEHTARKGCQVVLELDRGAALGGYGNDDIRSDFQERRQKRPDEHVVMAWMKLLIDQYFHLIGRRSR